MEREKGSKTSVFGVLIGIYALVSQVMTVYFWWKMAKVDNFITAMFIDPFIAEFKGLLWVFFI